MLGIKYNSLPLISASQGAAGTGSSQVKVSDVRGCYPTMADAGSTASPSEDHLWLRGGGSGAYTHYVAAVSNRRWPLASAKAQVAVCGFFGSLEEATAYAARHQRYKEGSLPKGPIFLVLECGRLFPLSLSPRRLFGDQSKPMARKRDAIIRNYYRKRELDRADVAARKGKEDETAQAPISAAELNRDPRLKRTVTRRARRHAWELLQRLNAQKTKLARAASFLAAGGGGGGNSGAGSGSGSGSGSGGGGDSASEMDDEMADFLESLTESQRQALKRSAAEQVAEQVAEQAAEQSGADNEVVNPANEVVNSAAEGEQSEPPVDTVKLNNDINMTPNTKLGTIDEYIAWAEQHFASQGIVPASDEMMDEEERREEMGVVGGSPMSAAKVAAKKGEAKGGAKTATSLPPAPSSSSPSAHLPPPPEGQNFCIGAIFFDDTGAAMNRDCQEALGMEHVVTFFEPHRTAEDASSSLSAVYAKAFADERLFFVKTGTWCCFDNVTDDDGVHMYREEMIREMSEGAASNEMLKFVEQAFEQRPDMLPIPTVK